MWLILQNDMPDDYVIATGVQHSVREFATLAFHYAGIELGWNPTKTSFEELVKLMVEHDMQKVAMERAEEHARMNLEEYLEKGVVK